LPDVPNDQNADIRPLLDQLLPKIARVKEVTLYLMSPDTLEEKEAPEAGLKAGAYFINPYDGLHVIFGKRILRGELATEVDEAVVKALQRKSKVPDWTALCFMPMHGIELKMEDGEICKLAVCLHCWNMSFDFPLGTNGEHRSGFKDLDDATLPKVLWREMPIPKELEIRFFGGTPKEQEEETQAKLRAYERWKSAVPKSIDDILVKGEYTSVENLKYQAALKAALATEFPEQNRRIVALFSWYGTDSGLWSDFPAYEDIPKNCLFEYTTDQLLDAVEHTALTETEIEGVARFFADWKFHRDRKAELALIPDSLCAVLLAHSLKSSDMDKQYRAKDAFERHRNQ
jgi:hypothetical protein